MIINRLYYAQPWLQELKTDVVAVLKEEEHYLVELAETIFYPTGGGQPHDTGFIGTEPVLDVVERDGSVFHAVAQAPQETKVKCQLDWDRRFDHMQQHTGQHLLSAVFANEYGYKTESFHLGTESCSIDITCENLQLAEQRSVEDLVNQFILRNLPLHTYHAGEDKLKELPIRKMPDLEGELRIVEIDKYDYSPCSGTHLDSTGQLGLVKLLKAEKYKGMTRVYFLAGKRALADYRGKHELTAELIRLLSVPQTEIAERLEQELGAKASLERELEVLRQDLMQFQAQAIIDANDSSLLFLTKDYSVEEAQSLARAILALGSYVVVIELEQHVVLTHNTDKELHLGQLVKEYATPLGGRGGGSPGAAQVYFSQPEQKQEFLHLLKSRISE